jgi:SAM-dependent methyltransferase
MKTTKQSISAAIQHLAGSTLMVRSLDTALVPRIRRIASELSSTSRTLDVGAKKSPYRNLFAHTRLETIDIRPEEHPDLVGDIHALDQLVAPNSYDLIICTEVLEHTRNPELALEQMRRALKPGGALLASTPFIVPYHPDPTDFWRMTEEGWKVLLQNWSRSEAIPHGNQLLAIWYLMGMGWGTPLRLLDFGIYWVFSGFRPRGIFLGLVVEARK